MGRKKGNHKRTIKRMGRTALFLFLLLLAAVGTVFASQASEEMAEQENEGGRVVKVAFSPVKGLMEEGENGQFSGLVVDYLNEIGKYTDWKYEYVSTSGETMVDDFLQGKFDLMGGTYYSPDWEQYFGYPDYSVGSSRATLLCRRQDNRMKSYDLTSLNGKTIGVFDRATEKIRRLKEFLSANALDCELKYLTYEQQDETGTLYPFLTNGEVDLLLANDSESHPEFRVVTSFDAQPYYIVTQVGDTELLDGLNGALESILDADPEFEAELYNKNFPDVRMADIWMNQRERDYVEKKHTVSVAAVGDWHPFYCKDNEVHRHWGVVTDMLNEISKFSGLEFTYIYADSYADAIELVREGKADILGCYLDTEEMAQEQGLALTKNYVEMNNTIIKNKYVNYPAENLTGALLYGRKMPDNVTDARVKYYPDGEAALRAVNQGEADFVYGLASALEEAIQAHHFTNVMPVAAVNNSQGISFAMARPIRPELMTVLNKGIGNMAKAEKNSILDRNLVSIDAGSMTVTELIYANPIAFILVLSVILILIVSVFLTVTHSRMKAALMQSELERAEAESRAKGEFLSRMSHEIRTPMNAIVGLTDLTCMIEDVPEAVRENLKKLRSSSQYLLSLINDILDMSRIDSGMMTIASDNFSLQATVGDLESMMRVQADQRKLNFVYHRAIEHDTVLGDPIRLRQVILNLLSNAFKFTKPGGDVFLSVTEDSCGDGKAVYSFEVRDTGVGIAPEYQEQVFGAFHQVGSNSSKSQGTGLGLPISQNIVNLMGGELKLESEPGKGSRFFFTLTFPLGEKATAPKPAATSEKLEGARVLVAEDNDMNAEITREILKLQKVETERAANGREAVDLFEGSEPGYYQVILMDVQMPVMNGLEATRAIRALPRQDARTVPIIAMTANTFKEDTDAAKEAGMTGFVPKPVDSNYLFEVLKENI